MYRDALKNAIIPTVAVLGVGLGNLVGSAVFVEIIFSRPGLGALVVDAISSRNFPIVRGAVLVIVVLVVIANLFADLSYRLLDPRIRTDAVGSPGQRDGKPLDGKELTWASRRNKGTERCLHTVS